MKPNPHPLQPMPPKLTLLACIGYVLMAWGGGTVARSLPITLWTQLAVPVFALGIVLALLAPMRALGGRVQVLEAELSAARAREQLKDASEQLRGF